MESGPTLRIGKRENGNAFVGFSFVSNARSSIYAEAELSECLFHGI